MIWKNEPLSICLEGIHYARLALNGIQVEYILGYALMTLIQE